MMEAPPAIPAATTWRSFGSGTFGDGICLSYPVTIASGSAASIRRRVICERLHGGMLGVDFRPEPGHILQLCATMRADIAKRQIAYVHPMLHEPAGDA
jgi:hypothetical protein